MRSHVWLCESDQEPPIHGQRCICLFLFAMSLNGLDSVEVTQAYQGALAEAGGWFLLRYTSRDAVEVLTRGTGGAGEARAAVAQYEDKSPLYGLLLYRRRKVLVKYVPEGTSRLLQARVAVHFINISEKFAPHDIVLPISTPEELSDAALTSACSLHTAAPSSSSSSSSSRQQKLSWIQEAAEEVGGDESLTRPSTAKSTIPTILEPPTEEPMPHPPPSEHRESVPLMLDEKNVEHKISPEISHVTMGTVSEGPTTPETDLSDLQDTLKSYESLFENGPEPRSSSQTARPNYDELYEHYYAQYTKPKVKLGPRPRPSLEGKRPVTSGSVPAELARPKSSLPAGLRSANRKTADSNLSKSTTPGALPTISVPPVTQKIDLPNMPQSPVSSLYSTRGPISVKSMPVSSYRSLNKSTGPTQEKTRLMKALEMRKKQQQQQQRKDKLAEIQTEEADVEAADEDADVKTIPTTESEEAHEDEPNAHRETLLGDDLHSTHRLSSSGLTVTENQTETDDLNSSFSISSPVSAQTRDSSDAPSTRPSSISEDETGVEDSQKCDDTQDSHNSDLVDERQSVDSQPTIVPESTTPIPEDVSSQHTEGPVITERAPSFDDTDDERGTTPRPGEETAQRSNRGSTIYMPSSHTDDAQAKKRNRESMLMPTSKRRSFGESKKGKRRILLDPVNVGADDSEAEYLSDDSFMDELQSATVHQAKPMSVSKSPITPFFPRKSSQQDLSTPPRSSSSNYPGISRLSPEPTRRKLSGGWPPQPKSDSTASKKINVSSGISQRIKALAEKTNRESTASLSSASAALSAPSTTLAQRKSSFFATTPLETSPNRLSTSRHGTPNLTSSTSSTPDKKKQTKPIKSTVYSVQRAEKPESVQVTARIVRDERTAQPTLEMPTESTPLELHQSPLIIDHQKATFTPMSPPRGRTEPTSPREVRSSHSREQSVAASRTSSESTWRSFGRRMSESKSVHSQEGDERRSEKKEKRESHSSKKSSKTSKMFKRMSSSISAMPWKNSTNNLASPENDMRSTSLASLREPPPAVHVGDLNIQFPDTLLWKRRWVEIDASGNLVLSPSKHNEKGVTKRFHLSDFRTPYPPDQDRQELPNSVVLDFVDGRTLQCACETYIGQAQVLQILREAHDAWLAYDQAQ
ncbi:gpi-anchored cell surface glyco [Pyrenophora seminiperda CCB06]|uniref:Gpi-anchored cell surface glyco n=1 Tax=Pyrenophora seminiperda CCB06 TaxID=1302712 RepID=A0A3M7M9T4_9PLEO|nr:gpi-anchored cell surface glyco [Pyrenophora seminiperda CCB06]